MYIITKVYFISIWSRHSEHLLSLVNLESTLYVKISSSRTFKVFWSILQMAFSSPRNKSRTSFLKHKKKWRFLFLAKNHGVWTNPNFTHMACPPYQSLKLERVHRKKKPPHPKSYVTQAQTLKSYNVSLSNWWPQIRICMINRKTFDLSEIAKAVIHHESVLRSGLIFKSTNPHRNLKFLKIRTSIVLHVDAC